MMIAYEMILDTTGRSTTSNSVGRAFNVRFPAFRAPPRTGKTGAFLKNKAALKTAGPSYDKHFSLGCDRACNMREMLVHLLLADAQFL